MELITDEGIEGLSVIPIGDPISVAAIIERKLKKLVIGEDPFNSERIWHKMYLELFRDRKGSAIRAISAVDIALWDIKGKALNLPLYKLLGGYRDKVPCYASVGYYRKGKGVQELVNEMVSYVDKGFKALKMRIGGASLREDLERVKAVREAVGDDIALMVDANHAYTVPEAIKAGKKFEKYEIYWFEDPVWPDDYSGLAKVADALDVPIATGELEFLRYGFKELIAHGSADILLIDATVVGGISEWIKVANMASAWNIPIAPHWEQEVHMHLAAAFQNVLWLEFFPREDGIRLEDRLYKEYFEPVQGVLKLPDKPGLGLELDRESLKKYSI